MSERTWADIITRLIKKEDLCANDASWAMDAIMGGEASPALIASFLTALSSKGETVGEVRSLADTMLQYAQKVDLPSDVCDIVGTGGDRFCTVNISTISSLVIAASGVPVIKHGNRASSSLSGSADCLEAAGLYLGLTPEQVADVFKKLNITFIFANLFHPSMRFVAPTRKELGIATVFNVLGPLTNPVKPQTSVIGVSSAHFAPIVAGVLAERGTKALVFRGDNGLDELSTVSPNHVWEVRNGRIHESLIDAVKDFGMNAATIDDLRGGDPSFNARVLKNVLQGEKGAVRDAVLLNVAGALIADGRIVPEDISSESLHARFLWGINKAASVIDSGDAFALFERWIALSNEYK